VPRTKPGICRLCLRPAELRRSHIIPEFIYEPLYKSAEHGRWALKHVLRPDGTGVFHKVHKGVRQHLLCGDCETLLNREYEHPSVSFWRHLSEGGPLPPGISFEDISDRTTHAKEFRGVPYRSWKLFLLSMLWRSSIAAGGNWKQESAGPKHEESLRRMLLEGDAGADTLYPCAVFQTRDMPPVLTSLSRSRVEGRYCFTALLSRVQLMFVVSSHGFPEFEAMSITAAGTLFVATVGRKDSAAIQTLFRSIRKADPPPAWMK
jgi:hypothetical protein